jgi:hypothetical protein
MVCPRRRRRGQMTPPAADPDISLVDVPWPAVWPQVPAQPLLEFRREALNPALKRYMVHRDAAVGMHHPLEVAVAS